MAERGLVVPVPIGAVFKVVPYSRGVSIFPSRSVIGRTLRNLLRVQNGAAYFIEPDLRNRRRCVLLDHSHYIAGYKVIGS